MTDTGRRKGQDNVHVILRGGMAFLVGVATFYFFFWLGGALLSVVLPVKFAFALGTLGSAICGVVGARFVWRNLDPSRITGGSSVARSALLGSLVVGGIGFGGGFFGPLIFLPEANQGPMLGIFITGPAGILLGAVGGILYALVRRK